MIHRFRCWLFAVAYGVRNGWWYGWKRYKDVRAEQAYYRLNQL